MTKQKKYLTKSTEKNIYLLCVENYSREKKLRIKYLSQKI